MDPQSSRSLPARDFVLGAVAVLVLGYGVLTANLLLSGALVVLLLLTSLLYRLVVAVERIADRV